MNCSWDEHSWPLIPRRCLISLLIAFIGWPFMGWGALRAETVVSLGLADLKIHGPREGEEISDANVAGDLNADGFSDLIVGSERARVGTVSGAGRAFLVFGGAGLPPVIDLSSLGARGIVIENRGSTREERLGHAVADAGDPNGDGIDDVLVSAPRASPRGLSESGAVYLIFGGGAIPSPLDVSAMGGRGVTILGARPGDLAGTAVSRAGDFNGDGIEDIIIGAEGADPASRFNAGQVYIIFGQRALPPVIDLSALGNAGLVWQGSAIGEALGAAVANLGDFNGDGLADVIASAPLACSAGRGVAGKAYIVFGSSAPAPVLDLRSLGSQGIVVVGPGGGHGHDDEDDGDDDGDHFHGVPIGSDVACGGDFNHDGAADALIGADLATPAGRTSAGRTYLVFGRSDAPSTVDLAALGNQGVVFNGVGGGDRSGHSVHCVGDFNADGTDDLMIGADKAQPRGIGNAGQSYLVFGRSSPPPVIELGALRSEGIYFNGEKAGDRSGHVVADAGDLNGDGGSDILVVARAASPVSRPAGGGHLSPNGRNRSGIVYVFHGKPVQPVRDLTCSVSASNEVSLSFTPGAPYDSIRVDRNGTPAATLAGDAAAFVDSTPPLGVVVYEVLGVKNGKSSLPARCEVSIAVRPPFGLHCLAFDGHVNLTWQHAQAVTETRIYRDGALLLVLPGASLAHQDRSVPPGNHEYRVTGAVGTHESEPAVCRVAVPSPVLNLACASSGSDVTLTWTAGQPDYSGLRIIRDGTEIAVVGGSSRAYVDNGVAVGSHLYRVQGLSGDHSSAAAECSARVLAGVLNLAGSSDGGDVTLSWEPGDVYEVEQVLRDGIRIVGLPGDAASFFDPHLAPGSYLYTVIGLAGTSVSRPASVLVEVPAPVEDLLCRADGNQARLSWIRRAVCDSIEIFRDGALVFTRPGSALGAQGMVEEFQDDTLPGPGAYSYRVVCARGNGRSVPADCILVSPPAPEPVSCTLVSGRLKVSWALAGSYDSIQVIVNGLLQTLLPGDASTATYDLGLCGAARVEVRGLLSGSRSFPARCEAKEIRAPFDFSCLAEGLSVRLSWQNDGPYEALRVERDGAAIASLPGDSTTFEDHPPSPGAYVYRLFGVAIGVDTLPAVCHVRVSDPVADLRCATDGDTVTIAWSASGEHHSVLIERNGSLYATLPAGIGSFTDPAPLRGPVAYGARLSHLGSTGPVTTCGIEVLDPPADFACRAEGHAVRLSWSNPGSYSSIMVLRNGLDITPPGGLPGTATTLLDGPVSPGRYLYEIQGLLGMGAASPQARCQVEVILFPIRLSCAAFDGEACLRWINPRSYQGIEVSRGGALVATLPGDSTSFCERDLLAGSHSYEVRGVVGGNVSEPARCLAVAPESPRALGCAQVGSDILLDWTPGIDHDAIAVYRDGELWSSLPGSSGSFLDADVPLGTHTYEVRGGTGGDFSLPVACAVEMAAPPRDLTCESGGSPLGSPVKVCWTPGAVYDSVTVLRNGAEVSSPALPGDQRCFTDPDLSPGVYLYEVFGRAGPNRSSAVSCVTIIIAPPFNLECHIAGGTATLSWSSAAPYDSIEVFRQKPSDSAPALLATLPGGATSYLDQPLTENGEHRYSLAGRVGGNRSGRTACSASRLLAPGELSCRVENATVNFADVRLRWVNAEAYDALIVRRNGGHLATLPAGAAGAAGEYLDRDLSAGTYDYQVLGERAGDSSDAARCTVQVLLVPPPIANLNCRIDGASAILSWSAARPSDQTRIYRRAPGEAASTLLETLPDTPTSYTDANASAPGDYRYEVAAVKEGIESSRALCDTRKPRPLGDLRCLAANLGLEKGDVQLTWTNAEAYESITVLRDGRMVAVLPGNASAYLDLDLPIGGYSYQLIGALGQSRSSPSAGCAVEVPVQPPDPRDVGCSIADTGATVRWTLGAVYDAIEIRRQGPGDSSPVLIATISGALESFQDRGQSGPGVYVYTVTGIIRGRSSRPSGCSSVLPQSPAINPAVCAALQAGPDDTDVLLNWQLRDAYDSLIVVRIRSVPLPGETVVVSLRGDQTSFADRRLPDGEYQYAVVGVIGDSSASSAPCSVLVRRPSFIRGEINNDRRQDIADPIYLVNFLFRGGPRPTCHDATDANDDGRGDLSDAVWLLHWQFSAGPPPPAPFPRCGKETSDDDLDCQSSSGCP